MPAYVVETNVAIVANNRPEQTPQADLNYSGQPGVGDEFFAVVHQYGYGPSCERVEITPCDGSYLEFPSTAALQAFDHADRKFVAAALASAHRPTILNAVDTDWSARRSPLESAGVRVLELCPQCLLRR